jgi:hypothetical protein
MTRTSGRPGAARASRIRFTLIPGQGKAGTASLRNHRPFEFGKHAHYLGSDIR